MEKTYIYHITAIDNLDSIIKCNGVYCKNKQPAGCRNIAYENIQARRSSTIVPIPPKGILHDYVPFYFAPRSPMLYAIHRGFVAGFHDGQHRIIYIVSSIAQIEKHQLRYVFTDGHAVMAYTEFFNNKEDLDKVDWEVMKSRYWDDTPEDGDRKRRRQAEFLVHQFFPLGTVLGIGVSNPSIKQEVAEILKENGCQLQVKMVHEWYY